MSYEDLIYSCRKLIAMHDVYEELWSMRIHNQGNCKAFDEEIIYLIGRIKEECIKELEK